MVAKIAFDPEFYAKNHSDLAPAGIDTPEELFSHWQLFGRSENRQPSKFSNDLAQQMAAYNQNSANAFINEFFAPDAVINFSGNSSRLPFAGSFTGATQINDFLGKIAGSISNSQFNPLEIIEEGNKVAFRSRQSGNMGSAGIPVDQDGTYVFTLNPNGLISQMDVTINTYALNKAESGLMPAPKASGDVAGTVIPIDPNANTETTRRLGKTFWKNLVQGKVGEALGALTPNVTWSFATGDDPELLPFAGLFQGAEGVGRSATYLASMVQGGNLNIVESFASGNRVLVRMREENAKVKSTGKSYNVDLESWLTVNNGKIESVETIVDSNKTLENLRPDAQYPFPDGRTIKQPNLGGQKPYYLVSSNTDPKGFFGSDETDAIAAFDSNGNFQGFFNKFSGTNNPQDGIGGMIKGVNGNILTSSQISNEILQYDGATGEFIGVFGDASKAGSGLEFPAGLRLGLDNNLYVSSLRTEQILKYDGQTGKFLGVFAEGNRTDNRNERFTDLDIGPDGNLYVGFNPPSGETNFGRGQVRVYSMDGKLVKTIEGLDFAASLHFSPDGLLYVSDNPAAILDLSNPNAPKPVDPTKTDRVVAYNTSGFVVHQFDVGIGNSGNITFDPNGILYLSNPASGKVTKYEPRTGKALGSFDVPASIGGKGRPTGGVFFNSDLNQPLVQPAEKGATSSQAPAVTPLTNKPPFMVTSSNLDPNGFFGNDDLDNLASFDANGKFLGFWNKYPGKDNPQDGITGMVVGPNGNVLVNSANGNRVLEYDALTGEYKGVFGDASTAASGLKGPSGLSIGPDKNVYVSSLGTEQLLKYDGLTGKFMGVFADESKDGVPEFLTANDFGPDGNLYVGVIPPVSDPRLGASTINVYDGKTGAFLRSIGTLDFASALNFGPDGLLYVSDDPTSVIDASGTQSAPDKSGKILVYNAQGNLVRSWDVGVGNAGNISFGPDGLLYLSNPFSGKSTVTRYNPTTGASLGEFAQVPGITGELGRPTRSIFLG